jgi:hypothetical protein
MFTLTLQISKLTKAVVLNSFPHGRFWQFVYKENVRCTRLMQRWLQVVSFPLAAKQVRKTRQNRIYKFYLPRFTPLKIFFY